MASKAPKKDKKDKREAILEAMLDLVVERGFHNAPMSVLAKQSGASAGVIYHYFPSKEDLIHALYLHVKSAKSEAWLEGASTTSTPREAFIQIWLNAYHFYRTRTRETRFLDLYENSPFKDHSAPAAVGETDDEQESPRTRFVKAFRSKKAGGVLKDLPRVAIDELSFGVAARLAKKKESIKTGKLEKIAEAAWQAISAE